MEWDKEKKKRIDSTNENLHWKARDERGTERTWDFGCMYTRKDWNMYIEKLQVSRKREERELNSIEKVVHSFFSTLDFLWRSLSIDTHQRAPPYRSAGEAKRAQQHLLDEETTERRSTRKREKKKEGMQEKEAATGFTWSLEGANYLR